MWPFRPNHKRPSSVAESPPTDPVVEEAKRRTHKAADAAKQGADRLNSQFVENHITLTILRTAGGNKHGR